MRVLLFLCMGLLGFLIPSGLSAQQQPDQGEKLERQQVDFSVWNIYPAFDEFPSISALGIIAGDKINLGTDEIWQYSGTGWQRWPRLTGVNLEEFVESSVHYLGDGKTWIFSIFDVTGEEFEAESTRVMVDGFTEIMRTAETELLDSSYPFPGGYWKYEEVNGQDIYFRYPPPAYARISIRYLPRR